MGIKRKSSIPNFINESKNECLRYSILRLIKIYLFIVEKSLQTERLENEKLSSSVIDIKEKKSLKKNHNHFPFKTARDHPGISL